MIMNLQNRTQYNKEEFIKRTIKHIRRVQDNMILLELNKDKLPFKIKEFDLLRLSLKHDIDKFSENIIYDELKITEYWYCFRNNIIDIDNKLISKEELNNISYRHYKNSPHHVEFYQNNRDIKYIILCEIASDMAAICQEYKQSNYTKYLIDNRNTKFKILTDFQVKILIYLLNLLKILNIMNI